jgi:hypothetical protein
MNTSGTPHDQQHEDRVFSDAAAVSNHIHLAQQQNYQQPGVYGMIEPPTYSSGDPQEQDHHHQADTIMPDTVDLTSNQPHLPGSDEKTVAPPLIAHQETIIPATTEAPTQASNNPEQEHHDDKVLSDNANMNGDQPHLPDPGHDSLTPSMADNQGAEFPTYAESDSSTSQGDLRVCGSILKPLINSH